MVEFIQWCFKDNNSGAATILIIILLGVFIIRVIKAIKGTE